MFLHAESSSKPRAFDLVTAKWATQSPLGGGQNLHAATGGKATPAAPSEGSLSSNSIAGQLVSLLPSSNDSPEVVSQPCRPKQLLTGLCAAKFGQQPDLQLSSQQSIWAKNVSHLLGLQIPLPIEGEIIGCTDETLRQFQGASQIALPVMDLQNGDKTAAMPTLLALYNFKRSELHGLWIAAKGTHASKVLPHKVSLRLLHAVPPEDD